MQLQIQNWPSLGRVGRSQAEATYGQYVYAVRDSAPEHWIILCQHPADRFVFSGVPMSDDNYFAWDRDAELAFREWAVDWLPAGAEEEGIERDLFYIRDRIVRARVKRARRRALRQFYRRLLGRGD